MNRDRSRFFPLLWDSKAPHSGINDLQQMSFRIDRFEVPVLQTVGAWSGVGSFPELPLDLNLLGGTVQLLPFLLV